MSRKISLWLIGLIIVALYAVPYLLLHDVATWYGSFLFWICAAVILILLNITATAGFKGEDQ